jgi:hypothetical protein
MLYFCSKFPSEIPQFAECKRVPEPERRHEYRNKYRRGSTELLLQGIRGII